MALTKFAPARLQAAQRRKEAYYLRWQEKLTFAEIAERIGVSASGARKMVSDFDAEFRDGCEDLAAAVREEQLGEINVLKRTWFPIANAPGSVDDRGIGAQNAMRALTALDKFIKLQIQQAKLVGANAPEKVESTLQGPGGGPVQTSSVDLSKLDTASLLELQAIMQRASSGDGNAQD